MSSLSKGRRRLLAGLVAFAAAAPAWAQEIEGDSAASASNDVPPLEDMALGPIDAKVTVIEYASATCPYCAAFHVSHFGALKAAYINKGKIRFVLREYPHDDAALAAFMVARCAPREKYFDYVDQYLSTQKEWTRSPQDGLRAIAQSLGMDGATLERCLKDEKLAKNIVDGRNMARSHGVNQTPAFYINGERYKGENTYEGLSAAIDRLLRW